MIRCPLPGRVLLCLGGLLPLIGALPGSGAARGGTSSGGQGARVDSLSAADVAFHFRYGALPTPPAPAAPPRDRWLARDKARHVVFSGLWTLSTQYVLVNKADWSDTDALPVSVASSATVGLAKELYDASQSAETASGKDLVADAVGIGLAVGLILL